jgi:hypothetical protein
VVVVVLALVGLLGGVPSVLLRERWLDADLRYDEGTRIAPSRIPGAGDGLYAGRDYDAGEIISEMGGRLVFYRDSRPGERGYLYSPPRCARFDVWPFDAVDGTTRGGRAWKVNFAPRRINGHDTGFLNTTGRYRCERPYVVYETTRPVRTGEEFLVSYGPDYDYDFMKRPEVRDHFCREAGLDCSERFDWEP